MCGTMDKERDQIRPKDIIHKAIKNGQFKTMNKKTTTKSQSKMDNLRQQ
jgi:hypothetical protein